MRAGHMPYPCKSHPTLAGVGTSGTDNMNHVVQGDGEMTSIFWIGSNFLRDVQPMGVLEACNLRPHWLADRDCCSDMGKSLCPGGVYTLAWGPHFTLLPRIMRQAESWDLGLIACVPPATVLPIHRLLPTPPVPLHSVPRPS